MAELLRMPAVAANADTAVLLSWSIGETRATPPPTRWPR